MHGFSFRLSRRMNFNQIIKPLLLGFFRTWCFSNLSGSFDHSHLKNLPCVSPNYAQYMGTSGGMQYASVHFEMHKSLPNESPTILQFSFHLIMFGKHTSRN